MFLRFDNRPMHSNIKANSTTSEHFGGLYVSKTDTTHAYDVVSNNINTSRAAYW